MGEEIVFARKASGLVRELTFQDVFLWAFAAPAASGINFYSVRMAYTYPGASAFWSFMIGSIIVFPLALVVALLCAAMPRAGGGYIWVSRVLHPAIGFWAGWIMVFGWGIAVGLLGYIWFGILGSALTMAGYAGLGSYWIGVGEALSTPIVRLAGAIIWVMFFYAMDLLGIRAVKWVERILTWIPLIVSVVMMGIFAVNTPITAGKMFNILWGPGVYEKINALADQLGYKVPAFSWDVTLASLVVPLWAWTAFDAVAYVSGEVKSPDKAFKYAYVPGYLWGWFMYCAIAFLVYYAYGDFIGKYVWLYNTHPDALKGVMPLVMPSVPFFAGTLTGNGFLGAIIAICVSLWFLNSIPPIMLVCSRVLFALSFDRALPEKVSEVTARGAPIWSDSITALWAIVGAIIAYLGIDVILGILDYTMFNFFWLYGIVAMVLPYVKPEIYKRSPMQWSIAGVPVISIIGFFAVISGFLCVFVGIQEFNFYMNVLTAVVTAIGMAIYAIMLRRNVAKGIDVSKIYAELPPA
jgi:amino acid transporter